jgi:hypothetical protein
MPDFITTLINGSDSSSLRFLKHLSREPASHVLKVLRLVLKRGLKLPRHLLIAQVVG